MSKRKKIGPILIGASVLLGIMMVVGASLWARDMTQMLLAVFVIVLYGVGQWISVVYWKNIQEDWETTGEVLGRLQQAVSDIPAALDSNLKSIATRLAENQQKSLAELQASVNDGARKTLETGAAQIGDSIAKNFKAPIDSLKVLLDAWEAKTREQADRIAAMAQDVRDQSAQAATKGSALIADSLDRNLRAPLAALQASIAESQEKSRADAEGAKALWEELKASQREWAGRGETLAASLTGELKALAAQGAQASEEGRRAWAEKAEAIQGAWEQRAVALEESVLASLRGEARNLADSLSAAAYNVLERLEALQGAQAKDQASTLERAVAALETQVEAMGQAASVFEEGLGRIREASAALIRDVQEKSDAGRAELIEEFTAAQRSALSEASRLLEAQGQLGLDVAGKVSELAAGVTQGSRDLQELAHLSQANQAEMQASVAMLNTGLSSILERLESQARAGEGYQEFLADLGRSLASFQERAAETLVENAMKTQEILMEVLGRADGNGRGESAQAALPSAASEAESEVASLS
jgi:hypothetical protein